MCCGSHCGFLGLFFQSCQADLVKDNGHKYFLSVLADPYMPVRTSPIYSDSLASVSLVLAAVLLFWCHVGLPPLQWHPELCQRQPHQPGLYKASFGVLKAEYLSGWELGLQDGCRSRELPHSSGSSLCSKGFP